MRTQPDEPVALSLAGVRGLGEAAVLLSLKDNSEESKLKRQVAQATKMQAIGQLAGGVAHDFNNILTAIIGHCDLMLMRHTPGDSDFDDIDRKRFVWVESVAVCVDVGGRGVIKKKNINKISQT